MRFGDAVARLLSLEGPFPEPPDALMPVRLDTGERRRQQVNAGPADAVAAAVLVLVAPDRNGPDGTAAPDAEAEIVLIERTARGRHSGEISFPGGRVEPDDAGIAAAALREAAEEVALDPARAMVRVVAELEPFWIPVSGYRVHPVVAVAGRRPDLVASPDEVVGIIRAPLETFLPGAGIEIVETVIREMPLRFGAYVVGRHRVWGATARVLGQLGAALAPGTEA